jgi:hypothetical protein
MGKLVGKIHYIGEIVPVSDKFQKREFVIETNDKFPQKILCQFTQEKVDLLNFYKVGTEVEVNVNIKGRDWTNAQGETKYFVTIEAWSINYINGEEKPKKASNMSMGNIESNFMEDAINQMNNDLEDDGLPF